MNPTPVLLAVLLMAQDPTQQQQQQQQQKPTTEGFWQKILRVTGISAMPSTSKGLPGDPSGDLWLANPDGGSRLRLTRGGGYQSPVFSSDGNSVLALRERMLVRVSTAGSFDPPEPLFEVPGVIRLVGSDPEAPEQVVVLTRTAEGTTDLGLLDLADQKVRSLRAEAPTTEYQDALVKLGRWDRAWQISEPPEAVTSEVRPVDGGSDVFCLHGTVVVNVSRCNGDRCGQLALSADGRKIVFVRSPAPKPS